MKQSEGHIRKKLWIHRVPRLWVDLTLKYPVTAIAVIAITVLGTAWLASMTTVGTYKTFTGVISGMEENRIIIEANGVGEYDLRNKECVYYTKSNSARYACEFVSAGNSNFIFVAKNESPELNGLTGSAVFVDVRVRESSVLKKLVRL